jgi:hypothetical protein
MDAMITAFPIRIGDRIEMGILKVFSDRDKHGRAKKLDPDNANIVLILDTEHVGPSVIHIHTYHRGLHCTIEVENTRKKRMIDKFIGELKDALQETPFDLRDVQVRVKRRKPDKTEGAEPERKPTTIDLRV